MKPVQKWICEAGIVKTFREADDLIRNGWVKVNNRSISSMLVMASERDAIMVKKGKKADWVMLNVQSNVSEQV